MGVNRMEVGLSVSISLKHLTPKVALLGLLLLLGGVWLPGGGGLRILVVHPLYAGSHALTLQVWQSP